MSVQKYDADKSRPTVVVENVTGKWNPQETEERIRNVLSTINNRFGPSKSSNKDIETFAELLAIEARFGEPLIKSDDGNGD